MNQPLLYHRILATLSLGLLALAGKAQTVTVTVANPTDFQRHEVVAVSIKDLEGKLNTGKGLVVSNSRGQQLLSQQTHDGLLLIDASVRPKGKSTYYICNGKAHPETWPVKGALYTLRKDDIAWENDRCAYRVYGPALQRTGERSFGTDIWVKNTPDTVVYNRYIADHEGNLLGKRLEREGRKAEADSVDMTTSFHLDHGNGLDAYRVGATLGLGAPALLVGDSLALPYCYKDYEILDNGPLRFTVSLTYNPSVIGNDKHVVEHRVISLDKGSNFNRMTVWYDGLRHNAPFATGVPIHIEDTISYTLASDYVAYADPTDNVERNQCQLYVATLFPNGISKTLFKPFTHIHDGATGHALGILDKLADKQRYTYYFGAAWSAYDVRTMDEWQLRIKTFLEAQRQPLVVSIK